MRLRQHRAQFAGVSLVALLALGSAGCEQGQSKLFDLLLGRFLPEIQETRRAAEAELSGGFAESPASGPPPGSDVASLGPDAATRIYYQFIDRAGMVRFVERLDEVPSEWRERVGFVELAAPPPLTPGQAKRTREQRAVRNIPALASTRSTAAPDVILYYAQWCPWCRKAKAYLEQRRVPYELRDIDNPAALAELIDTTGQRGIPVIDVNGKVMIGFSEDRLARLLARAT